jgi:superfamily II DNA or RNA helicase
VLKIEAIKAGMQPGLTVVVGPPGTGKTDVAVQIISNIYHNWPEQRTLIVTHSNQALNALFEKIIKLDVDERHLLRMGKFYYFATIIIVSIKIRPRRRIFGNNKRLFSIWESRLCFVRENAPIETGRSFA